MQPSAGATGARAEPLAAGVVKRLVRLRDALFALFVALVLLFPSLRAGPWGGWPLLRVEQGVRAPVGVGLLALLPATVALLWLATRLLAPTRRWRLGALSLALPLLALTGLTLAGSTPTNAAVLAVEWAAFWFVYAFVVNERPPLLAALATVVALHGAVALGQFLTQGDLGLRWLGEPPLDPFVEGASVLWARGQPWLRGYGLTGHPNSLGALLATLLLLLLPAARHPSGGPRWLLPACALGLAGLLVSFSRAAWLALAVGALAGWVSRGALERWSAGTLERWSARTHARTHARTNERTHAQRAVSRRWLVLLLVAALLLPYGDLVASRWVGLSSPIEARSLGERLRDAELALRVIARNPQGVGVGNLVPVARQLQPEAMTVHNVALLVAAEVGLLGLACWLWLTVAGLRRPAGGAPCAPWVGLTVVGLFDVVLWPTSGLLGAVAVALLAAHAALHLESLGSRRVVAEKRLGGVARALRRPTLDEAAWGLLLLLGACFALEPTQPLVSLGGALAFSWVEGLLLAAVGLWLLACLRARRWPAVPRPLGWAVALWLAVLLAAALLAPDQRLHALKFWSRVLNGVLVGWATFDLARSPARWRALARALAVAAAAVGLLGLAEAFHLEPVAGWLTGFKRGVARVGELERISASLSFPTITAVVLELTLPLLLVWAVTRRARGPRLLLAALLLAALGTLVLTLARAGVALVGSGFLLVAGVAWWQRRRPGARPALVGGLLGASALAALALLVFVVNPVARLRLTSETDESWYRARYEADALPPLRPNQAIRVPVQLVNQSVRAWSSTGRHPMMLSYHLREPDGTLVRYDGARTAFTEPIGAGERVEVQANLVAPEEPGDYVVEWDVVQEDVTWFSWKGTPPLRRPLTVRGEAAAPALPPSTTPDPVLRLPTPGRLPLWRAGWQMFLSRPLLGVGPDTFRLRYGPFLGMSKWDPQIHANNMYVEWLAGSGLLGLLAFAGVSGLLLRHAWDGLRPRGPLWLWRVALAAGLVAWYAHGLLDSFWAFTPSYVAFWMVAGLTVAAGREGVDAARPLAE